MPIYAEQPKNLVDALSNKEIDAWYPSNDAARKWWRCVECIKDLDLLLEPLDNLKNSTKRKRLLKTAITPLHSLVLAINDLINDCLCNKETKRQLKQQELGEIKEMKALFNHLLPHDHKSVITNVRNKLSAHIDKSLHPYNAQEIAEKFSVEEFGRWLDMTIHLAIELTNLNIYSWSCKAPSEEYIRFMTNEPYIVTLKVKEGEPTQLVGLNISNSSPKNEMPEAISSLLKNTRKVLKHGKLPPSSFNFSKLEKGNWTAFKELSWLYEK